MSVVVPSARLRTVSVNEEPGASWCDQATSEPSVMRKGPRPLPVARMLRRPLPMSQATTAVALPRPLSQ